MSAQPAVVAVAILVIKPGHQAEFEAAALTAVAAVHQEPGCMLYALHRQAGTDDTYVMVEKWASKEALRTHGKGAALSTLNKALADIMAAPADVRVLAPLAGGSAELGVV